MAELVQRAVELQYIAINLIHPNEWNPQDQKKEVFEALVEAIKEHGCIDPIQVVQMEDGTYRILGGEHRWAASKEAGLKEIPCAILTEGKWREEDLQKVATVKLNALKGHLDPAKFLKLHAELGSRYTSDALRKMMGFTDAKVYAKLLGGVKKNIAKSLPPELQKKAQQALDEAKTVQDLGTVLNTLLAQYGDTLDKGFMVFSYGGQNHLFVAMDKTMRKGMDRVVEYCRATGAHLSSVMAPIVDSAMNKATEEMPEKTATSPGSTVAY